MARTPGPSREAIEALSAALTESMGNSTDENERAVLDAVYPIIRQDVAREIAAAMRDEDHMGGDYVDADWVEAKFGGKP
jgi:hypothetical protein